MDAAKTFACRDDGESPDCSVVVRREIDGDVVRLAKEHGRQTHGTTDEQLGDPAVEQGICSYIRGASSAGLSRAERTRLRRSGRSPRPTIAAEQGSPSKAPQRQI